MTYCACRILISGLSQRTFHFYQFGLFVSQLLGEAFTIWFGIKQLTLENSCSLSQFLYSSFTTLVLRSSGGERLSSHGKGGLNSGLHFGNERDKMSREKLFKARQILLLRRRRRGKRFELSELNKFRITLVVFVSLRGGENTWKNLKRGFESGLQSLFPQVDFGLKKMNWERKIIGKR